MDAEKSQLFNATRKAAEKWSPNSPTINKIWVQQRRLCSEEERKKPAVEKPLNHLHKYHSYGVFCASCTSTSSLKLSFQRDGPKKHKNRFQIAQNQDFQIT